MSDPDPSEKIHIPVMVAEVLDKLGISEHRSATYVDATVGTGGHALEIVKRLDSKGLLVGIDVDGEALDIASGRLKEYNSKVKLYRCSYGRLEELFTQEDLPRPKGILFDFGLSTLQIEDEKRGFSFTSDGPLDMRMDDRDETDASDLVNSLSREKLKEIIRKYGEEKWASRIASSIVEQRETSPIKRTERLAKIIEDSIPDRDRYRRGIHPATLTFQALRIAVNDELENIHSGLQQGFDLLIPGGNIVTLAYHSLEDRIVKRFLKEKKRDCICPPKSPVCRCDKIQEAELLTDGPLRPSKEEVEKNNRSRSARLRAARKL